MVSRESKTSSDRRDPGASEKSGAGARRGGRKARKSAPLDEASLRDLALSYVARFATTAAKLEGYLARKVRERGVALDVDGRELELDVAGLVARLIELGYVDDASYARSRSRDLTARGYGQRRVEQALWAAGVEEQARAENIPSEAASRRAAMLLAKKRRLGPYTRQLSDLCEDREEARKLREKQVAAMLRAGHLYEHAQFILQADNPEVVENWVIEAENEEEHGHAW